MPGRLGLETARVPHADRHGLLHLDRGELGVVSGCLRFRAGGSPSLAAGEYSIPHQSVSMIMLGPGSTVTHDALRLLARHGTLFAAVGADGVRQYTAPPLMADTSEWARRQMELWSDLRRGRMLVARRMYAKRMGEIFPDRDIETLRGMEGARVKSLYAQLSQKYGVEWHGRRYNRSNPTAADLVNQAINHAATAVEAAATIAVTATATIPQLGFIHEDSAHSFVLDIADLFRDRVTLPCAFRSAKWAVERPSDTIERICRKHTGEILRREQVIPKMIDSIKSLLEDVEKKRPALTTLQQDREQHDAQETGTDGSRHA